MTRRALALTLLFVIPAVSVGAQSKPHPPLRRVERILARYPIPGDSLRIVATVLLGAPGDPLHEAVETVRIEDRSGRVQFSDSLRPTLDPAGGLEFEIGVKVVPIQWDKAPGLRLELEIAPGDYPPGPPDSRFFVLRGKQLVPVTPWCGSAVGPFPGDEIRFVAWMGCLGAHVPARVQVDRPEGGVELIASTEPSAKNLSILSPDTLEDRYFQDETGEHVTDPRAPFRVTLFRGPTGDASDMVTLTPSTPMAIGRLYAEPWLKTYEFSNGKSYLGVSVAVRRLEITLGTRRGFIEPKDFKQVGLYEL